MVIQFLDHFIDVNRVFPLKSANYDVAPLIFALILGNEPSSLTFQPQLVGVLVFLAILFYEQGNTR